MARIAKIGDLRRVAAVRQWKVEGTSRRDSVLPDIALVTIHVTAGEPEGAAMAHRAITSVA